MSNCLFCEKGADSCEHAIPQWVHRRIAPESKGKYPVYVGRFLSGKGYIEERHHVSTAFTAKIVCQACNSGWMSKMESEVKGILAPFTQESFPILAHTYLETLKDHKAILARWMVKTALLNSYALPGKISLPRSLIHEIVTAGPPGGVWLDAAKAKDSGIAAALTKTFPTINGRYFVGSQTHTGGGCFQFCLQINQLLLRVGMTIGAEIGYVAHSGLNPFRLFPLADRQVPEFHEFNDINHFMHSILLRTWDGCPGEVPLSQGETRLSTVTDRVIS